MGNRPAKKLDSMLKITNIKSPVYHKRIPDRDLNRENLFRTLSNDGCEDFYNYIEWLDLAKSADVLIIPRTTSFYYIPEDLKNIETVINLKPLNLIKDLKPFLSRIYSFIPEYSYFTGCFDTYEGTATQNISPGKNIMKNTGNVYDKKIKNSWLNNIISRLFRLGFKLPLTRKSAKSLLAYTGFTVFDMTVLNGKTYFCAQKRSPSDTGE